MERAIVFVVILAFTYSTLTCCKRILTSDLLLGAYSKAVTVENIRSAWREVGMMPFDDTKIQLPGLSVDASKSGKLEGSGHTTDTRATGPVQTVEPIMKKTDIAGDDEEGKSDSNSSTSDSTTALDEKHTAYVRVTRASAIPSTQLSSCSSTSSSLSTTAVVEKKATVNEKLKRLNKQSTVITSKEYFDLIREKREKKLQESRDKEIRKKAREEKQEAKKKDQAEKKKQGELKMCVDSDSDVEEDKEAVQKKKKKKGKTRALQKNDDQLQADEELAWRVQCFDLPW